MPVVGTRWSIKRHAGKDSEEMSPCEDKYTASWGRSLSENKDLSDEMKIPCSHGDETFVKNVVDSKDQEVN